MMAKKKSFSQLSVHDRLYSMPLEIHKLQMQALKNEYLSEQQKLQEKKEN